MKQLHSNQLEKLQGGDDLCLKLCAFNTPVMLRFIFLLCDAPQLNGWLVADDLSPILECIQIT